jgi:excisionase family DNA binding protein
MPTEDLELLSIKQVAETLNCSKRHVWRLLAHGDLPAIRIGGLTRVSRADLNRFIAASMSSS